MYEVGFKMLIDIRRRNVQVKPPAVKRQGSDGFEPAVDLRLGYIVAED